MRLLYEIVSLAIVFVMTFGAGVWLVAQIFPDRRGPPGWLVISMLFALSSFTAYAVVIQQPHSDCTENTPQGSGTC